MFTSTVRSTYLFLIHQRHSGGEAARFSETSEKTGYSILLDRKTSRFSNSRRERLKTHASYMPNCKYYLCFMPFCVLSMDCFENVRIILYTLHLGYV
jgi:hypothetical protein